MTRGKQAVLERVKRDTKVQIRAFPGQTVRTVFEKAKGKLWETKERRYLVVITGALNDVLRKMEQTLGSR